MEYLIIILVGSSVYLLATSILQLRRPRPRLIGERGVISEKEEFNPFFLKILKILNFLGRINLPYLKELRTQAEILKINTNISYLILFKIVMTILAGILTFVFLKNFVFVLVALMIGFFLPDLLWTRKIKGKKEAIVKFFPETVDLLDLSIGAGLDFTSAVQWIVDKSENNPFVEQLEIVLKEIRVGKSRIDALKAMAERLRLPQVSSFVRTIVQAERMGTPIEEAFRILSEDMRSMRFEAGERYAIKASLKILFPLLFCILPVILIVVAGPVLIKFTQGGLFPGGF